MMQSLTQILMKCVDSLRNGDNPFDKVPERRMPMYSYSHPYPEDDDDDEHWDDYLSREKAQGRRDADDHQNADARREEIRQYLNPPCVHERVRLEVDGEVYCANPRCNMYLGYRELGRKLPTLEELDRDNYKEQSR